MINEDLGLSNPVISFSGTITKSDPSTHPVLVIGQMKHLKTIDFDDFSAKFHSYVDKKTYNMGLMNLNPTSTDSVHLWLNNVTLAVLPTKCSRHNTPSRAHSISKLVKEFQSKPEEYVVMVCERKDVIASACAIAKTYPIFTRKTTITKPPSKIFVEFLIVPDTENGMVKKLSENELKIIATIADSVRFTARIVDTPCNEMNVDAFIKEIEFIGKILNITPNIIRGEELKKRNMGGIYGVGKAAACPPALVSLSYLNNEAQETVAWVGKGIVYDTGGLSLKISGSMVGMKRDCGGAAAILGAFYSAVKCNFKQNLHAVFCLAENSVGPLATRPDDIHTLYSGNTVEINNTDAEGRLVMADGVAFAKKDLGASIILDMATLTGAQGVATGKFHAATVTNSEDWEKRVFEAGKISGDLVFPLPYAPEMHFQEYKSHVADMKNSVADRTNAQVACAGLFVAHNIGFDYEGAWIHVDMAATSYHAERATGYGVALLVTLFGNYMDNEFVKSIAPSVSSDK